MRLFTEPIVAHKSFQKIMKAIEKKKLPVTARGLTSQAKCNLIAALSEKTGKRKRLIITHDEVRARELVLDMKLYDKKVFFYPAKDFLFFAADLQGNAILKERMEVLKRLALEEEITVVTSLEAGLLRQLPLSVIKDHLVELRVGDSLDLEKLRLVLTEGGYELVNQISDRGQFAIRGGLVDVFPLAEENPFRVELWGDEIDSIRSFDGESQRSIENLEEIYIYPAKEIVISKGKREEGLKRLTKEKDELVKKLRAAMKTEEAARLHRQVEEFKENLDIYGGSFGMEGFINYFSEETSSFFDFFSGDGLIFVDEPHRLEERGKAVDFQWRESMGTRLEKGYILPGQAGLLFDYKEILASLLGECTIFLNVLDQKTNILKEKIGFDMGARQIQSYHGDLSLLVKDLKKFQEKKYKTILVTSSTTRAERLAGELRDYGLSAYFAEKDSVPKASQTVVVKGGLTKGFEFPSEGFALISETDVFGEKKKKKAKKKKRADENSIASFSELHEGDYVIHDTYGIGIYRGIEKITRDYVTKDYVKIEYADESSLYLSATGLDLLQKYSTKEGARPRLSKLGGKDWTNTKNRVKASIYEVAKDLVALYARRNEEKGYAYSSDTVWQTEFEEMFPFEETEDQLAAISDVKRDMESTKIMDRLICGDVGFGKTEVAIRAAFKAVTDGKQVAVLVPTTILAGQHYQTFKERMKNFPISVDFLSRFKTEKEVKKIKERLANGSLDIVIGTHKLLGKDISFKDIGLLIIDEEQRFGVSHKEKIKKLRTRVDVLTLSATPIPRTLHMSLTGIRDMSLLEEPPADRLPIQTYVLEHDDEMIREAILRELSRGGQVYYVYNRVKGIEDVAEKLRLLLPDARISYAHGQMSERELEAIMTSFISGEIEVLLSTTIIETGIDISNVNTIIIDDADRMGLSQLYQLRGRVGRSTRTSFAFLMYKQGKLLKEVAEKRLAAIKEFTDLGSGFRISMRDLEIRGAGNLLGKVQSGHIDTVGYELYCKLLNEAVRKLKGEASYEDDFETKVDISIDAHIPVSYIKNEVQRLEMYKKIAAVEGEEDVTDLKDEFLDRYGDLPETVDCLIEISYLRFLAHEAFVEALVISEKEARLSMYQGARLKADCLLPFVKSYEGRLIFKYGKPIVFVYKFPPFDKKLGRMKENYEKIVIIKGFLKEFREGLIQTELQAEGGEE